MLATSDLHVRVRENCFSIAQIAREWEDLWTRCRSATIFQHPEWLRAWLAAFQPSQPWLLEVRHGNRLVAIAPFLFYSCDSDRVLGLMGGGVSDYLDVLVDRPFAPLALPVIWQRIRQEQQRWNVVCLTDLSSQSPLLSGDISVLPHRIAHHDCCSVLNLPSRVEDLKNVVPAHKLANLRNARRRMQKAGDHSLHIADSNAMQGALDDLFGLHRARWAQDSQPGVLADPSVQAFHRHVAAPLLARGLLRFYRLCLNGHCIACLYTFIEREQVLCYLQGFDPQFSQLSPGTQILGAVIEDAVRAGKKRVNFLRGQEGYKYGWGVEDENTFRLEAHRAIQNEMEIESKAVS